MAIRNIVKSGDEVLTKKSREVKKIDERVCTLIDDMIETMREANGVGLAAVQVGVLKRVVVIEVEEGKVYELINPVIVEREGERKSREGCLSCPGVDAEVIRPEKVVVEALDRNGEMQRYEGEELFGAALCHELDHLDGITIEDIAVAFYE